MVFRLQLALAVWLMAVRATLAAEVAPATAAPVATATSDATSAQIDAWLADDGAEPGVNGASPAAVASFPPRAIHGEASVSMGSDGYRAASIAALVPVGATGTLGVGLADARLAGRRGGEARSLDISLSLGAGAPQEPCGLRHTGPQLLSDTARLQRCGADLDRVTP